VAGINLSGILYIYKARLEARTIVVQEAFAILGIAVGVALLFASQVASTSLRQSTAQLTNQFVGSAQVQLEARGPEGVSEQLLREARHASGVQVALPIFERQLNLIGRRAERSVDLIGVDPMWVRASGPLLRRFSAKQLAAQQAIALPEPLAAEVGAGPLEPVKLQIGARFSETLVGATLGQTEVGGMLHSPVAVATLSYAQRLAGAGARVNRIFVRYAPARARQARSALQRLAAAWNVNLVPGRFDDRLFAVAVAPESNSETMFSAISALVGFMFALNAMLITVPSRRALIEEVRPHGATRWDTIKILLFDAAVIGVLACALGLVLGELLSIAVFHSTPGYLTVAFPVGNTRIVSWQSVSLAIAAGMAAAALGVFWPLREILARPLVPADQADRHRSSITVRIIIGVLCLATSATALLDNTQAAILGNVALVGALIILLPPLFDGLVALFGRLSNVMDGVGSALAVTELQTPHTRVRSLAIAATAAVAVFGVVEFQGAQANLEKGLDRASRGIDSAAQIWVMPRGKTSVQPTTPFAVVNTAGITRLPGVSNVSVFRGSFLNWGDRRLWLLAPSTTTRSPVPTAQITSGNPVLAAQRIREGGWATLSQALAAEHHLHVGQSFVLPSPRPLRLRVAALMTNLGWPPGALILNSRNYEQAWVNGDPTAYAIQTTRNANVVAVRNRIRQALASLPGLAVETDLERNQRRDTIAQQGLSRLTQIRLLVLIAAILAIVGAVGAMIWQRRDLIAFIKCQGYDEAVLCRWLLCEAAILLSTGCAAGAAFGLYGQALLSHALTSVTGFPMVFDIEGVAALTSFITVIAIALAVVAVPGYLVVRVPPSTASPAY
jgi:putative ABC transport system permease protein